MAFFDYKAVYRIQKSGCLEHFLLCFEYGWSAKTRLDRELQSVTCTSVKRRCEDDSISSSPKFPSWVTKRTSPCMSYPCILSPLGINDPRSDHASLYCHPQSSWRSKHLSLQPNTYPQASILQRPLHGLSHGSASHVKQCSSAVHVQLDPCTQVTRKLEEAA